MVNKIYGGVLEGLFPNFCALCGLRSYRNIALCAGCEQELPRNNSSCYRCGIPIPDYQSSDNDRACGNCLRAPPPFHRVIAPWLYSEQLAHLIHSWKYGKERRMTDLLAALWLQQAPLWSEVDLLVPVPLHWSRLWQRGFNQSELLARRLCTLHPRLQSCPLAHRLVRRQRATAPQSGMNIRQRAGNLRGAFTVRQPCDNLRVAVVDDILTTGATAADISRALLAAGATHVEVWCLARTPAPAG